MYITDSRKRKKARRRKRILVILLLFIGAFIFAYRQQPGWIPNPFEPTPTPTISPSVHLLDAEMAVSEGRLKDAIEAYKNYLAIVPDDAKTWTTLARWQIWQGEEADALKSARKAVELDKSDAMANAVLAWALDWNNQIDDAIAAAVHALDLNPNLAETHAYMAEINKAAAEAAKLANMGPTEGGTLDSIAAAQEAARQTESARVAGIADAQDFPLVIAPMVAQPSAISYDRPEHQLDIICNFLLLFLI